MLNIGWIIIQEYGWMEKEEKLEKKTWKFDNVFGIDFRQSEINFKQNFSTAKFYRGEISKYVFF